MEFLHWGSDGVLLYSQQEEGGVGDFIALSVVEGRVLFAYNLGSGAVVLKTKETIPIGSFVKVSSNVENC